MATFEEAVTEMKSGGRIEVYGVTYTMENLSSFLSNLNSDSFLFFSKDYKIIKNFTPRRYEYEAYMGEDINSPLASSFASDLAFDCSCSPLRSSSEYCDGWERISKWKVTMEELEITDEEKR